MKCFDQHFYCQEREKIPTYDIRFDRWRVITIVTMMKHFRSFYIVQIHQTSIHMICIGIFIADNPSDEVFFIEFGVLFIEMHSNVCAHSTEIQNR